MKIAAANMANAIREITVEQGLDPREATLVPFGGAGPLFVSLLARSSRSGGSSSRCTRATSRPGGSSARTSPRAPLARDVTPSTRRPQRRTRSSASCFAGLGARGRPYGDGAPGRRLAHALRRPGAHDHVLLRSSNGLVVASPRSSGRVQARVRARRSATDGRGGRDRLAAGRTRTPLPRRAEEHVATASDDVREESSGRAYSFVRREWLEFAYCGGRCSSRDRVERPDDPARGDGDHLPRRRVHGSVHESGSIVIHDQGVVGNGSR